MKLFNKNNQYKEANLWIDKLRAREEQKQSFQTNSLPTTSDSGQQVFVSQVNRTIFTQADRGHNLEETQLIQKIYGELESVPLLSVLDKLTQVKGLAM